MPIGTRFARFIRPLAIVKTPLLLREMLFHGFLNISLSFLVDIIIGRTRVYLGGFESEI